MEQCPFTSLELIQQAEPCQPAEEKTCTASANFRAFLLVLLTLVLQPGIDDFLHQFSHCLVLAEAQGWAQLAESATQGSSGHRLGRAWHPKAVRTLVEL